MLKELKVILKEQGRKHLQWEDFNIISLVGKGGLGEVYLGELSEKIAGRRGFYFAIKRISKKEVKEYNLTEHTKF